MMPTNASDDDWALHLARFAHSLRDGWDIPGLRSAIHNARPLGSREDIAHALIELTKRDDLKTPALLAQDGPHWHTGRTPNARVQRAKCEIHEHEDLPCRWCRVERLEPSTPDDFTLPPAQVAVNERWAGRIRVGTVDAPTYTDRQMAAAGDVDA